MAQTPKEKKMEFLAFPRELLKHILRMHIWLSFLCYQLMVFL